MTTRAVTWGDAFGLRVTRAGGMPKVVARLKDVWGVTADSRATLDKLRATIGPESMSEIERWRAYQVLVVIGEDPADWGIDKAAMGVPPGYIDYFHAQLDGPADPSTPGQQGPGVVTLGDAGQGKRRQKRGTRRNMVYNFNIRPVRLVA